MCIYALSIYQLKLGSGASGRLNIREITRYTRAITFKVVLDHFHRGVLRVDREINFVYIQNLLIQLRQKSSENNKK